MNESLLEQDRQKIIEIARELSFAEARRNALLADRTSLFRGLRGTCAHDRVVEFQLARPVPNGKDYSGRIRFCLRCGEKENANKYGTPGMSKALFVFQRLTAQPIAQVPESELGAFTQRLYLDGRFDEFDTRFPAP